MGEPGFSVVGAIFLIALFVPNLLWARWARPSGYDPSTENRGLRLVERIGQVLTTTTALALRSARDAGPVWSLWLVAAVVLMVAYEACWVRYFLSRRTAYDFYRPALGVPVPLASLPVSAFLLLGVYEQVLPLVASALALGVGHIGIHLGHWRRRRDQT